MRGDLIWNTNPWLSLTMPYVCLGCRYKSASPSSCQVSIRASESSWSTVWVHQRKYTKKQAMYKPPRGLLKVLQVLLLRIPGLQRISKRDDRIKVIASLIRSLDTKWDLNIDSVLFLRANFGSTGWDTDYVRAIYIYWLCQSCTIRSAEPFNNNLYEVIDLFYCPVVR